MIRRCLVLTGLSVALILPLLAEAEIQRYLSSVEGFQFIMENETASVDQKSSNKYFEPVVLTEAGFSSYSRWRVIPDSGSRIQMEIYQVRDSSSAFQLFSHWPKPDNYQDSLVRDLPISAQLDPSGGVFWRGKFFFRISSVDGRKVPANTFSNLVKVFFDAVSLENRLPVSITHLPEEGQLPESVRFYLGEGSLRKNERFPQPLLEQIGLTDRIEIAFAEYGENRDPLFLVGYPTVALAKQYIVQMQDSLEQFFSQEGVYIKRTGVLIGIFIGQEEPAREVLSLVNYQPTIQWLHEKKPKSRYDETITFLGLITQTILGIGMFLVLVLGTGLSFGLVRYEFIRRFPHIFRKEKMVRLDLNTNRSLKDQDHPVKKI